MKSPAAPLPLHPPPTATAQLRKLPDRIDIVDREIALSYCKANHPEAVIVREDISKTAVRSLIFTEGEAIPASKPSSAATKSTLRLQPKEIPMPYLNSILSRASSPTSPSSP